MFIKGVGCTKFGLEQNYLKMIHEASFEALNQGDLGIKDIDMVVVSNLNLTTNGERQRLKASLISSVFKKTMPIIHVPSACEGGGVALWTALNFLKNQENGFNNILVLGYEKLVANLSRVITDDILMASERLYEQEEGLNFPAQYALVAQQHMLKFGSTEDDFALIAEKNHFNAALNPKARFYKKNVSLSEIKKSPVVASPLRIHDCSISSNGSACVIVSNDKSDIEVKGSAHITDSIAPFERDDMTSFNATKIAADNAFKQAGIERQNIDIAEVHDAFTPAEIISYEDLGFAEQGLGMELIRKGNTKLDGRLPVNTSGGLKAKGHPISATGLGQIYELVKQLKGEAGERQVQCTKALAHNNGGCGSSVAVHILEKVN
tara:strand:+ start:16721 stop:17854 length:1134 start_codon:yes stop_codon:yes gene_type:complete